MTDTTAGISPIAATATSSPTPEPEVAELRQLLQAANQADLDALRQRVSELERLLALHEVRAGDVSRVLPAAISSSDQRGTELNDALRPQVFQAIHRSSRDEPEVVAEALYPVLGRAVRMIIASMFTREDSSGRSFRVEQLFLIERESGLPMWSVAVEGADDSNVDVVSGMLEAIRSFVQDSFETDDHDGMRELTVGEVSVWVEWGPQAVLAAVIRGVAPEEYRLEMQQLLETLHVRHAEELSSFSGDPEEMRFVDPHLVELRDSRASRGAQTGGPISMLGLVGAVLLIALVVVLLVGWIG